MRLPSAPARLAALSLAALPAMCGTMTTDSVGTDAGCAAFDPILWSRSDTMETARQVQEHNAAWRALCDRGAGK